MVQRLSHASVLMCSLVMLAGCGLFAGPPPPSAIGTTPETTVRTHVLKQLPPDVAQSFTWLSTHPLTDGAIVLYTTPQFGEDVPMFQVAWRDERGWFTNECCDGGGGSLVSADGLDGIAVFSMLHTPDVHVLIVRALTPEVAQVEATFNTGETSRAPATNGLFVLAAEDALNICEMRLLDPNGTVLRRTHLWGQIVDEPDRTAAPVCQPYE